MRIYCFKCSAGSKSQAAGSDDVGQNGKSHKNKVEKIICINAKLKPRELTKSIKKLLCPFNCSKSSHSFEFLHNDAFSSRL